MKILITGYFDAGNYGDDIMLLETIEYLKSNNIDYNVLFLNYKRDDEIIDKTKILDFSIYSNTKKKIQFFKIINDFSAFFWVGGTCFTNTEGNGCFSYMLISKLRGLKIGYLGIGVNYITDKKRLFKTRYLLKNSDFVNLRDEKSLFNIKKMKIDNDNIKVFSDIFYLSLNKIKNAIDEKYILISLREISNICDEDTVNHILDSILNVIKKNYYYYKIRILPLDNQIDFNINKKLFNMLKNLNLNVELEKNLTIYEKTNLIKNSFLNITGRLHSACISEFLNKKVVVINYNEKISIFLKEINCENHSIDINNMSSELLYGIITNQENITNNFENLINKSKQGMENFILYIKSI